MALSKEVKDALSDHYKNTDLYDPSKAPEQEVTTYKPKALCMGGAAEYAEGGEVADDFSGPALSSDTDTVKGTALPPPPTMELPSAPPVIAPPAVPQDAIMPKAAAAAATAATMAAPVPPGKMPPDEYAQLIKALGAKPTFGQSAMSGLAGLADAIETGVARAGNPGFQKNLSESQQNQKRNLIDALRAKYESNQGTRRITEEERHNKSAEKIGSDEAKARLSESKAALQQNALEAMGRLSESGGITGRILGHPNEAQTAINALAERAGLSGGQPKIPTITTKVEYNALPKGTHYQDANGKQGIKK